MNLQSDDFEIFDLPARFALDEAELTRRRAALQRQVHPDRFAAQGAAAQRVAMQWSARINEAYRRLHDPLLRATYLCERAGEKIDGAAAAPEVLQRQLDWHERLEAARAAHDDAAMMQLKNEAAAAQQRLRAQIGQALDVDHDAAAAAQHVRELMFVNKIAQSLNAG